MTPARFRVSRPSLQDKKITAMTQSGALHADETPGAHGILGMGVSCSYFHSYSTRMRSSKERKQTRTDMDVSGRHIYW